MKDLTNIVERLRHNPAWGEFQQYLFMVREETIRALADAPEGTVREISGRVQAYDTLLQMSGFDVMALFERQQ
jgi:hypothetical protein